MRTLRIGSKLKAKATVGFVLYVDQPTMIPISEVTGKERNPRTARIGPGLLVLPGASNAMAPKGAPSSAKKEEIE
jgi:hypothetical protein